MKAKVSALISHACCEKSSSRTSMPLRPIDSKAGKMFILAPASLPLVAAWRPRRPVQAGEERLAARKRRHACAWLRKSCPCALLWTSCSFHKPGSSASFQRTAEDFDARRAALNQCTGSRKAGHVRVIGWSMVTEHERVCSVIMRCIARQEMAQLALRFLLAA